MRGRPKSQITILSGMSCVCAAGFVLGILARYRDKPVLVSDILLSLLVIAGPGLVAIHFAIEANRREESGSRRDGGGENGSPAKKL